MKFWLRFVGLCIGLSLAKPSFALTPEEAFKLGQDLAEQGKQRAGEQVQDDQNKEKVPHFSEEAPEQDYFEGGNGHLKEGSAKKRALCAQGSPAISANFLAQNECDAINFVVQNPSQRQPYPIDQEKDELMKGSKDLIQDPSREIPQIPGKEVEQCHVEIIKKPPTYVEQTCTETRGIEQKSCEQVLVIKRSPGGCQPGTHLGRMIKDYCPGGCINPYFHTDVFCGADQGYEIAAWTARSPNGPVYSWIFSRRAVPGRVGFSQSKTFIVDAGKGCHFPMYYSQSCTDQTCQMSVMLSGSTCPGHDFTATNTYPIPFTYTDDWEDGCAGLESFKR